MGFVQILAQGKRFQLVFSSAANTRNDFQTVL